MYQDTFGAIDTRINAAPMAGSYRPQGGQQSIIDSLCSELEAERVWLNYTVQSLTLESGGVSAECVTSSGTDTIQARRVVLAVPPRLVASAITFLPKLMPEQTQAMHDMPTWIAGQSKVAAVYSRPFWRDHRLSGEGVSRIGPLSEIHDASPEDGSQGALCGFVGWSAQQRKTVGKDLIPQAISQLQQMFGVEAGQPLQVSLQDWAIDPLTATAADSHQHGHPQFGLPPQLEGVWHGRIMFSSAEMAEVFGGLVEGALEAAEAAFNGLMEYPVNQ